jgi:hypothetical protein
MNSVAAPRAVLGTTQRDYPGVQARGQAMANSIQTNIASFPSLPISIAAFVTLLTAFVLSQQVATETRAKGAAKVRNTKAIALWSAMEAIQKYIQGLANGLSAEAAAALIESGGLLVAKIGTHQKAALTAALTATQGNVLLVANRALLVGTEHASKHVQFNWQWSPDGGKTWNSVASTPLASTEIPGLTLMSTCSFRVSVTISKQPTGPWSQVLPTHLVDRLPAVELRALA